MLLIYTLVDLIGNKIPHEYFFQFVWIGHEMNNESVFVNEARLGVKFVHRKNLSVKSKTITFL